MILCVPSLLILDYLPFLTKGLGKKWQNLMNKTWTYIVILFSRVITFLCCDKSKWLLFQCAFFLITLFTKYKNTVSLSKLPRWKTEEKSRRWWWWLKRRRRRRKRMKKKKNKNSFFLPLSLALTEHFQANISLSYLWKPLFHLNMLHHPVILSVFYT